jgi:hypothetical protein
VTRTMTPPLPPRPSRPPSRPPSAAVSPRRLLVVLRRRLLVAGSALLPLRLPRPLPLLVVLTTRRTRR